MCQDAYIASETFNEMLSHSNGKEMPMEDYLKPKNVCELVPGMTESHLGQLRYTGKGPKFLKPTPRTVLYRRRDVIEWLETSERTSTAEGWQ